MSKKPKRPQDQNQLAKFIIYSITDNELTNLLSYIDDHSIYSSIRAGAFSIAFTLITNAIYTGWNIMDTYVKTITIVGTIASIILGCISWRIAYKKNITKQNTIDVIKNESSTRSRL